MSAEAIFPSHFGPINNKLPSSHHPFVVLITGAGKGIGYHIALSYAQAGATGLIITSRTQSDLNELSKQLLAINPELDILSKAIDTSNKAQVAELAVETSNRFHGHLDVAIAFAGVISSFILPEGTGAGHLPIGIEDNDFQSVMTINVTGTWYIAQHFIPLLSRNSNPASPKAFIASASTSAHAANTTATPVSYNLSRLATVKICELLHSDYHTKTGLQTFAVAPGHVWTGMTSGSSALVSSEFWKAFLNDDVDLCGGFLTWLTKERREWLSGRLVNVNYDVEQLEVLRDEILREDKLKFRYIV